MTSRNGVPDIRDLWCLEPWVANHYILATKRLPQVDDQTCRLGNFREGNCLNQGALESPQGMTLRSHGRKPVVLKRLKK
jgi:hypothetical protein